jgi:hypothetical protein
MKDKLTLNNFFNVILVDSRTSMSRTKHEKTGNLELAGTSLEITIYNSYNK